MIEVIQTATYTARKKYRDDGRDEFNEWVSYGCYLGHNKKITFAEARIIVEWRNDRGNNYILPGMKYERQFNKMDGRTYTFRMRKDIFDIACKYGLWNEY